MTSVSVSNVKAVLLYSIVSFFLFFEMAVQVSPSVMSFQLMQDLHISVFGLGIMSGIYFYSYAAMQIPSGILFDRYPPRLIITTSILICALGTLLFSFAPNIYIGALARLLMGCGSAFAFVSVLVVTADLFSAKYFATMTGITQMLAAFGAMMGQMPLSVLVDHVGWRQTLFILFVIGVILAAAVWTLLNYQKASFSPSKNNTVKNNLLAIMRNNQTWFIAVYACLLWVPMSSFASLWGVPFLIKVLGLTTTTAAFLCSMMWLGLALASPLLGLIATKINNLRLPLIVSALVGAIAFGLVLYFHFSVMLLGTFLFLAGAACSGQALSFTLIKENNGEDRRATAIAFNNMAVVISGAVFQPVIGKIIQSFNTLNGDNYKAGLTLVLGSYSLAFIISLFFIKD